MERVKEAVKLGFKNIYLPASNQKYLSLGELGAEPPNFHWIQEAGQLEIKFGAAAKPSRASVARETNLDL
jgi:hypothetical protein